MIGVTAVGRVVNPKSSGKSLTFGLVTPQPLNYNETQVVSVIVFLEPNSKIQNYIRRDSVVVVNGQLEIGKYQGKTTVRIVSNSRSISFVNTGRRQGSSEDSTEVASEVSDDTKPW